MECNNCKKEIDLLHRVNEKGVDGIWWCGKCIKEKEPELYKNIQEEDSIVFDIYNCVKEIEKENYGSSESNRI